MWELFVFIPDSGISVFEWDKTKLKLFHRYYSNNSTWGNNNNKECFIPSSSLHQVIIHIIHFSCFQDYKIVSAVYLCRGFNLGIVVLQPTSKPCPLLARVLGIVLTVGLCWEGPNGVFWRIWSLVYAPKGILLSLDDTGHATRTLAFLLKGWRRVGTSWVGQTLWCADNFPVKAAGDELPHQNWDYQGLWQRGLYARGWTKNKQLKQTNRPLCDQYSVRAFVLLFIKLDLTFKSVDLTLIKSDLAWLRVNSTLSFSWI